MLKDRDKLRYEEFFPDGAEVVQAMEAYLEADFIALHEKVEQYLVEGQIKTALSLIFFAAAIVDFIYKHYFYQGVNPGFLAGHGQISFAEAQQLEKRLGLKPNKNKNSANLPPTEQYDTISLWTKLQSLNIYTLN